MASETKKDEKDHSAALLRVDPSATVTTETLPNRSRLNEVFGEPPEATRWRTAFEAETLIVDRLTREKATMVEDIALFVERLRDDYQSTAMPVAAVARVIREHFGSGNQPVSEAQK